MGLESVNAGKLWKWVYQILLKTHGRYGVMIDPLVTEDGAQVVRFVIPMVDEEQPGFPGWPCLVRHNEEVFASVDEKEWRPTNWSTAELRTTAVVPKLIEFLGLSEEVLAERYGLTRLVARWSKWRMKTAHDPETWLEAIRAVGRASSGENKTGRLAVSVASRRRSVPTVEDAIHGPRNAHEAHHHPELLSLLPGRLAALVCGGRVYFRSAVVHEGARANSFEPSRDRQVNVRLAQLDQAGAHIAFAHDDSSDLVISDQRGLWRWRPGAEPALFDREAAPSPFTFCGVGDAAWLVQGNHARRWGRTPEPPEPLPQELLSGVCVEHQGTHHGTASAVFVRGSDGVSLYRVGADGLARARRAGHWRTDPGASVIPVASADSSQLLIVGGGSTHQLVNVDGGACVTLQGPSAGHPTDGALQPRGPLAAVFSRVVTLYDTETGELVGHFGPRGGQKTSGAFCPNGRFLVVVTDRLLLALKCATGQWRVVDKVARDETDFIRVEFSPNGHELAIGHGGSAVDAEDGDAEGDGDSDSEPSGSARAVEGGSSDEDASAADAPARGRRRRLDG